MGIFQIITFDQEPHYTMSRILSIDENLLKLVDFLDSEISSFKQYFLNLNVVNGNLYIK